VMHPSPWQQGSICQMNKPQDSVCSHLCRLQLSLPHTGQTFF